MYIAVPKANGKGFRLIRSGRMLPRKHREENNMAKRSMLGPTMLKVFEEEINNLFRDLLDQSKEMEAALDRQIDVTARKELGIYDLSIELAKAEMQVKELKRQMEEFTDRKHIGGDWTSLLEVKKGEVRRRLMGDSIVAKIRDEKQRIIREVRIASLGEDIAKILREEVPKSVAALAEEVKALPQPDVKSLPVFEE